MGIYQGTDGFLYCDGLKVDDIRAQAAASPFYLYSKEKIRWDGVRMQDAREEAPAGQGAAVEARPYTLRVWDKRCTMENRRREQEEKSGGC